MLLLGAIPFFMVVQYSNIYIFHSFFTHYASEGHLGCFQLLAITNSAAVNSSYQLMYTHTNLG